MAGKPCKKCGKTAYPLESVKAGDDVYHKLCFKCSGPKCGTTLNVKTFKKHPGDGQIYCSNCLPKEKHTQVADTVVNQSAKKAESIKVKSGFVGVHKGDQRTRPGVAEFGNDKSTESGEWESTPDESHAGAGSSWGQQEVQSGEFESTPEQSHAGAGGNWGQQEVQSGEFESTPEESHAGAGGAWGQQEVEAGEFENDPDPSYE
jgi:hypothetical protein